MHCYRPSPCTAGIGYQCCGLSTRWARSLGSAASAQSHRLSPSRKRLGKRTCAHDIQRILGAICSAGILPTLQVLKPSFKSAPSRPWGQPALESIKVPSANHGRYFLSGSYAMRVAQRHWTGCMGQPPSRIMQHMYPRCSECLISTMDEECQPYPNNLQM